MNVQKELRKHRMFKQVEQAMKDPRMKKWQDEREREIYLNAFVTFALHSCDYLYRVHRCKKNGILKFLSFLKKQMEFVQNDPDYFTLLREALMSETGVDVVDELGCREKEC